MWESPPGGWGVTVLPELLVSRLSHVAAGPKSIRKVTRFSVFTVIIKWKSTIVDYAFSLFPYMIMKNSRSSGEQMYIFGTDKFDFTVSLLTVSLL